MILSPLHCDPFANVSCLGTRPVPIIESRIFNDPFIDDLPEDIEKLPENANTRGFLPLL